MKQNSNTNLAYSNILFFLDALYIYVFKFLMLFLSKLQLFLYTIDENIIGAHKMLNNYGAIHKNYLFYQYCDSNIGVFFIALKFLLHM